MIACSVIAGVIGVAFVVILIFMLRMPAMRDLLKCQANMASVGGALSRYSDVNGAYPPDLDALKNDYLRDPSVLRCPLDTSKGDKPSYSYHRPAPDSPDDFVVLECNCHRAHPDMPRLMLLRDGTMKVERPAFSKAPREGAKKAR